MKIAMIASESNPLAKSGGLADVVYSLSAELAKMHHEVIVVMPYYKSIKNKKGLIGKNIGSLHVDMSWRNIESAVYEEEIDGVKFYLIDNQYYFGRDSLYGYDDDGERFAFFALASIKLLEEISFKADIIHVHDWQSAMIPCLVKEGKKGDPFFASTHFVLTIHNPAFKGILDKYFLGDFFSLSDSLFDNGSVRFEGMVSTLKSGIVYADKITTVSPTHRGELLTPLGSQGLSDVLRLREADFAGFLNGIDTNEWDPSKDNFIAKRYDIDDLEDGKHANQKDLLSSFNVHWYGGPVYGIVSRLSWQKGINLVIESGRKALANGANLLVLGSGEYELEQKFEALRRDFPDTCGIYIGFSNALAHKIYAGSDFFLMPSLFEPCGISQMVAQRYGTLPIVRYTGGLRDTVEGYEGKEVEGKDGIGFNDYDVEGLDYGIGLSRKLYSNQKDYYAVARNAMKLDRGWHLSAQNYLGMYQELVNRG